MLRALTRSLSTFKPNNLTNTIAIGKRNMTAAAKLSALRDRMKASDVDVYVVPSEDAHQSEYIADCDARRAYISGFNGSAGCAVITTDKAALFTDGRYFNQAGMQLDLKHWTLMKVGLPDVPTWTEWVLQQAEAGKKRVGIDASLLTATEAKQLMEKLKTKSGELIGMNNNLVDEVWSDERPKRPAQPVFPQPYKYSGQDFSEKVAMIRKELEAKKASGSVVSMLDEIAWLFNLRGDDIPFNPVFFSFALITPTQVTLYIDESKLTEKAKAQLGEDVTVRPYDAIFSDCSVLSDSLKSDGKILITNKTSWALAKALGEKKCEEVKSCIADAKAVKNATELEGMRQCHIRDGAALIEYFAWLEEVLHSGKEIDEVEAADYLEACRKKKEHFAGLSFPTISSTGPNGAIIHYQPEKGSCAVIDPKAVYLCDSGAQYKDGTTDVTRTLHFGSPSLTEKRNYTLVLKGHIAIARAVFPKGTTGYILDILARQFLWRDGLNYLHGTGHGVGSYLNVHEGPPGIGTRISFNETALAPGMVLSNEPGYYEDGQYGIRIENLVTVKEVETPNQFGGKPYYGFETITLVPMARSLIDISMLDSSEIEWLNEYHKEVLNKMKIFFDEEDRTYRWLERETRSFDE
ncbi:hypothetical protein YB2330_000631 [Saitoella coloradoensis]